MPASRAIPGPSFQGSLNELFCPSAPTPVRTCPLKAKPRISRVPGAKAEEGLGILADSSTLGTRSLSLLNPVSRTRVTQVLTRLLGRVGPTGRPWKGFRGTDQKAWKIPKKLAEQLLKLFPSLLVAPRSGLTLNTCEPAPAVLTPAGCFVCSGRARPSQVALSSVFITGRMFQLKGPGRNGKLVHCGSS